MHHDHNHHSSRYVISSPHQQHRRHRSSTIPSQASESSQVGRTSVVCMDSQTNNQQATSVEPTFSSFFLVFESFRCTTRKQSNDYPPLDINDKNSITLSSVKSEPHSVTELCISLCIFPVSDYLSALSNQSLIFSFSNIFSFRDQLS